MKSITLPPEQLPILRTEEVSVVVCRGPERCTAPEDGPCVFCVRIDAPHHASVAEVEDKLNQLHS